MADGRRELPTQTGTKLSREQKAGLMFVIVCGFGALILGGQYLWTHMASPFVITYTGPRLLTGAEQDSAEIAAQKKADTDADGVNDYDEVSIYKTSPYLNDSDSDGLFDGAEISAGQDPLCATGETCASGEADNVVLPGGSDELDAEGAELQARAQALENAMKEIATLPAAEIRTLLIDSGGDAAAVNAMTDDEVITLYQQILVQLDQDGSLDAAVQQTAPETSTP
jgi:hypothetical protein